MNIADNPSIHADASQRVRQAIFEYGMVNVPVLAEEIKRRHPEENTFDIEHLVLGYAQFFGAPVVFDSCQSDTPVGEENAGLLIDFVADDREILPT